MRKFILSLLLCLVIPHLAYSDNMFNNGGIYNKGGGGGGTPPGGASGDVQYNSGSSTFAGNSTFHWDNTAKTLKLTGSYTGQSPSGALLDLINTSASGQNIITSTINGSTAGQIRNDFNGNISYAAYGGSGVHSFYIGGDYPSGTNVGQIGFSSYFDGGSIFTDGIGGLNTVSFHSNGLYDQISAGGGVTIGAIDGSGMATTFIVDPILGQYSFGGSSNLVGNAPLYMDSSGIMQTAAFSGTNKVMATATGTLTSGGLATWDGSDNLISNFSPSGTYTFTGTQTFFTNNIVVNKTTNPSASGYSFAAYSTSNIPAAFVSTTTYGAGGGAGMVGIADNGAAVTSGARLGYLFFNGATDSSHTNYFSTGIEGLATENFSGSAGGSKLVFSTTANTTQTRSNILTLDNDKSATFAGIVKSAAHTITSASSNSLAVGPNGTTNPVLQIDDSIASAATGLSIQGSAAGGGTTLQAISSASTEKMFVLAKGSQILYTGASSTGGQQNIYLGGTTVASFLFTNTQFTPQTSSTASTARFSYTGAADTALTLSTEAPNIYFNLGQTRQHATGTLALQRDFRITPSTHSFVGASALTEAAAFAVDGAPPGGTNATIGQSEGLLVSAGAVTNTTNAYGAVFNAPTGASSLNAAALFVGPAIHALGSNTSPSIAFTGDTNTGFYGDGSHNIFVSQNGTNNWEWSAAGSFFTNNAASGRFGAPNGSTSVPGIGFSGQTGTGFSRPSSGIIDISNSGNKHGEIDNAGHIFTSGTIPTAGTCGTSPTVTSASTDNSGSITVGTGASTTSCAINFASTWTTSPNCVVSDDTNVLAVKPSASATVLTVTSIGSMSTIGAGDVLTWICQGNQ